MGFDNARIILDSPSNSYFAGQTVNGRLTFSRDKAKKFRGIYVHLRGYCKVHWTSQVRNMNSTSEHDRYRTVNHDSYEDYFDQKVYLAGGSSGDHHLPPGNHDLPFIIRIPENCPSALEGEYGHVRYEMRVVVDRAFKMDQELTVPIKILAPLDLNLVPNAREPIHMKMEESYCCWCVNAGSSETLVKLPATGFCPGHVIPMELSCINRSSEEINIKLAIKKELTFRAQHVAGTQHSRSTLLEDARGPVPAHVTKNWAVELAVPELEALNLRSCSFIDVQYELKVTVSPSGCHEDSEDSCYLIFGTVPLGGSQPLHPQAVAPAQMYPHAVTSQPLSNSAYPNPYPGYPNQIQPYPGQNSLNLEPIPPNSPYPSNTPYPAPTSPYPPNPYPPTPQNVGFQTSPNPLSVTPYPTSPYPPEPKVNLSPGLQGPENPPYPMSPPSSHSPYPASPYPPGPKENPLPGSQGPENPPYPMSPPSSHSPYPASPYPPGPKVNSLPGSQENPPYPMSPPSSNLPYPSGPAEKSPLPGPPQGSDNPPYPISPPSNPPYATPSNPPYATPGRTSPYPTGPVTTSLKTGTFGFMHGDDKSGASIPLLPDGAAVPMPKPVSPNPYAASAPEPSTPDDANKPLMPPGGFDQSQPPPYNPAFANQKTD